MTDIFDELESEVQSYARAFPVTFNRAKGSWLYDQEGKGYLDFLAGAGTLNYGHNNDHIKQSLLDYIQADGITHGLDMHTDAKENFLNTFNDLILKPRKMQYKMQFTGPTGTNAVEAALKVVRNVTGRSNIVAFTNGFHGVSLGAMAATGNSHHRDAAGISLPGVTHIPFDGYGGQDIDSIALLDALVASACDNPAGGGGVTPEDWWALWPVWWTMWPVCGLWE